MTFAHPALLVIGAAVLAAFVFVYRAAERRGARFALAYSNIAFADRALRSRVPFGALLATGWIAAVAALGLALAGPRVVANVPSRDASVVLCIDTSGSMASTDVAPTRADAARDAARAFVAALPDGTPIAIVSFSTNATVVVPLSSDRQTILDGIDRIPAPNGGTAIGDALLAAANQLPAHGKRAIVLVTDGVNNHGSDPVEDAQQIGSGVSIETVGIGTNNGGMVPGTAEPAELDEEALRSIADAGHGTYARVSDAGELRSTLAQLGRGTVWERHRVDASLAFAGGGGALMVLTFLTGMLLGKFP